MDCDNIDVTSGLFTICSFLSFNANERVIR